MRGPPEAGAVVLTFADGVGFPKNNAMKRHFIWVLAAMLASTLPPLGAATPLEAHAAREELIDFIKTTQSRLRDMEQALQSQQRRITQLEDENRNLRVELTKVSRNNPAAGLEEDIKQLEKAIQEVDRKRLSDANSVDEKMAKVERIVTNMGKTAQSARSARATTPTPRISSTAKTYEYEVEPGDYLVKILSKLKSQTGVTVSQKAVEDANPGVQWKRLQVGQKLVIPVEN